MLISRLLPWDELLCLYAEAYADIELIEFGLSDNLDHRDETIFITCCGIIGFCATSSRFGIVPWFNGC